MADQWTADEVHKGIESGKVFRGRLRVNPKQHKDAFISIEGKDYDLLIHDLKDRNRSFHDDMVAVEVFPEALWKPMSMEEDDCPIRYQWTGHVVRVMESRHTKYCAGHIKIPQQHGAVVQFMPRNRCHPFLIVPRNDVLRPFLKKKPVDVERVLFLATIDDWPSDSSMPHGTVVQCLGEGNDIDTESNIMLRENGIIDEEFSNEVIDCLPNNFPWRIPVEEMERRKDFRDDCVFTIDPSTARDLDDALSCSENSDGTWNVGVHIADVSYFVEESTPLDDAAKDRATSVYLIQRVIPMLPRVLCEQLCSLNPGEDRLTYSVVWKMNNEGDILETQFHRSVIRSCVKLSYGHAQSLIDGTEVDEVFPEFHGRYGMADTKGAVRQLWSIAQKLRAKRFDNGALKLSQPKLIFSLDEEGNPAMCTTYQSLPSNSLIEEFMLLANITVAEKIHNCFPDHAILRRHPMPKVRALMKAVETCQQHGITLDCINSKAIQHSIDALISSNTSLEENVVAATVTYYCSKAMELAQYFCSCDNKDPLYLRHYALSVPIYTHFTSPIRRYPDIMVHRLLTAALNHHSPHWNAATLNEEADHCNGKRLVARRAQDTSGEIYLKEFIRIQGSFEGQAVIVGIMDKSVDVLLLFCHKVMRVHQNKMQSALRNWNYDGKSKIEAKRAVTFTWKHSAMTQKLMYFSKVEVSLTIEDEILVTRIVSA